MQKSIQTRLFDAKKDKPISFNIANGKEIKGILRGHEQYSITIETENGNIETYYKHFVSKVNWGKVKFQFNKPKTAPKQEGQKT